MQGTSRFHVLDKPLDDRVDGELIASTGRRHAAIPPHRRHRRASLSRVPLTPPGLFTVATRNALARVGLS
jgi:hypothetical protein